MMRKLQQHLQQHLQKLLLELRQAQQVPLELQQLTQQEQRAWELAAIAVLGVLLQLRLGTQPQMEAERRRGRTVMA